MGEVGRIVVAVDAEVAAAPRGAAASGGFRSVEDAARDAPNGW